MVRDMIYVRVSINGSSPVWMNLDTGASHSAIDPALVRSLRLHQTGSGELSGIGRGQSADFGRVEGATIQVGGYILRNQSMLSFSMSFLASQLGHATDGTLGSNIFNNYVVRVDYARKQIVLEDPAIWKPDHAGQAIPIELRDNVPFVEARIVFTDGRDAPGMFLIDIGQIGAALSLNGTFLEAHPGLLSNRRIDAPPVASVGGTFRYRIARASALKIGPFTLQSPITVLPEHAAGIEANPNLAGVIGADVLSRFTVIFDYSHGRIFLTPNEWLTRPFETDMSGLRLTAQPPLFDHFEVAGVADQSPAREAGFRDGDVITGVDGRTARTLTLADVQESLERVGELRRLTVQRGRQTVEIALRLRRLI